MIVNTQKTLSWGRSRRGCFFRPRERLSVVSNSICETDNIESILFSEEDISSRVSEVAVRLAHEYLDKEPLILCTLKGAFMFHSDLVRNMIPAPRGIQVDFLRASSYGSATESCGEVTLHDTESVKVAGRHVILVEDIVDTGRTLKRLTDYITAKGALSVRTVALLDKPSRREVDVLVDFQCFECPDEFVVGYGLDYDEDYRTLPYIGVLKESTYRASISQS